MKELKMRKRNSNNDIPYTNPGDGIYYVHSRRVNENGEPVMVVKEKRDLFAEIQTYENDNNIDKILKQFGGDINKVNFNKGVYMDLNKIPDNYNDFYNRSQELREDFDLLPIDLKQKLKNNFNLYYGLAMTGKLKGVINDYQSGNFSNINSAINSINVKDVSNDVKQNDLTSKEVLTDEKK